MAWTAKLREARPEKDHWNVVIVYTDGTATVTKGYQLPTVGDGSIKALARSEVANFEAAAVATVTLPPDVDIDLTPPTPAPPPTPTAAEIAEAAWFADFRTLRQLRVLADHGLMSATAASIVTLQNRLKAAWLPEYLERVG
jgi:hypothetical protein